LRLNKFAELAKKLPVVSLADVRSIIPGLRQETLSRWNRSGKIIMVAPGFYVLPVETNDETDLFAIAGRMYTPSFVSLESALSFYGLIPETVLSVTSVCTRKTRRINSPLCTFIYRSVQPEFFFGYEAKKGRKHRFLMASPERAIVDLLYLRRDISSSEDMLELRFDAETFNGLDPMEILDIADRFNKPWLKRKVKILLKVMKNA
jgi:predicted transcriptional regulator of viral defense system